MCSSPVAQRFPTVLIREPSHYQKILTWLRQEYDIRLPITMTGLVIAEAQEGALGPFANQVPSVPVRQPSKEDLELAHQLVRHSEGRRGSAGGSLRAEHAGSSNSKAFEIGSQNGFPKVGQMVENGVEKTPNRHHSSVDESQHDLRFPGQIHNPMTMGQVCRYDISC